jgi:hypothetical protein
MCFSVERSNQSAERRSKSAERSNQSAGRRSKSAKRSIFGSIEWGWLHSSGKEEQI